MLRQVCWGERTVGFRVREGLKRTLSDFISGLSEHHMQSQYAINSQITDSKSSLQ